MPRTLLLVLLLSALLPSAAMAGRPVLPALTEKQARSLADGKPVMVGTVGEGSEAMVTGIIEIGATPEAIWAILVSNDHIVASSGSIKSVTTYHDVTTDGVRDLRLAFVMKVGWSEIRFHSHRTQHMAEQYMTWELDRSRENDIESTSGSYSTWPASARGRTRFLYEARIDAGKRVPGWMEEELTESSLKKFLVYVQSAAETAG